MSSDSIRTAAGFFLYGMGFIFAGVVAYQVITGIQTPNALAVGIVNIIIGYVINSVGVQHGVNVTNDVVAKTTSALPQAVAPLVQAVTQPTPVTPTPTPVEENKAP